MRSSLTLICFGLLAASSSLVAQVFDEKFEHWPVDLKINGTIIIHNQLEKDEIWTQACLKFSATGDKPETPEQLEAMLLTDGDDQSWEDLLPKTDSPLRLNSAVFRFDDLEIEKLAEALQQSSVAILDAKSDAPPSESEVARLRPLLASFLEKGGTLVANSITAKWLSTRILSGTTSVPELQPGLGLMPDTLLETRFVEPVDERRIQAALAAFPRLVGIGLRANTCLVFQGRKLFTWEAGEAQLMLAANEHVPRRRHVIGVARPRQGRYDFESNLADLTQWRRDAIDRTLPPFPPADPPAPYVEEGTLIIVGGGGMPENLMKDFVNLAGGENAHLVYIPCTENETISPKQWIIEQWKKMGVQSATVVHTKDRNKANSDPAILEPLAQATGIWFGGGRQWNFADSYYGTEAHRLMKQVLKRGGVIGGSSAGASVQARYLARATPIANYKIMAFGYERGGLGFLSGVAIDQHFTQRGRQKDMTLLMKFHPQLLGIGIDEATAIIVNQSRARVIGRGKVHFYDRRQPVQPGQPDFIALPTGSVYDLKSRKIIVDTRSSPAPATEPAATSRSLSDEQPQDR